MLRVQYAGEGCLGKKKDRRGAITDFHFEPAEGWTRGPMITKRERIKQHCVPIYERVTFLK